MTKKSILIAVLFFNMFWGSLFAKNPQSVSVIRFVNNYLILADSKQATLFAYKVNIMANTDKEGAYNLNEINLKIALLLGTKSENIVIKDLAIQPESKEAYIAIEKISGKTYVPVIVVVNQKGEIKVFDLNKNTHTEYSIKNAPVLNRNVFRNTPIQTLTFTDFDFYKGKLYISGMSNADFSSALRVVDFPFNAKNNAATTSVEIYHAVHNQMETRAPIRTMDIITLDGKEYILAVYTCTPLVLFPLADIKDGAHVVGKTIAELGYGNTPIDIMHFTAQDEKGNPYDVAFILNKNRETQVISFADITKSSKADGLKSSAGFQAAGTPFFSVPMAGLIQADILNNAHIVALRRDTETGKLALLSYMKGLYFRLSDFVSDYNLPGYKYPESQNFFKGLQNNMKMDEGYPEEVVK
jgi:hypothetical protein